MLALPTPKPTLTATADPMPADRRQRYGQQAIDIAIKIIDASTLNAAKKYLRDNEGVV
jgi:hypothetical protein